jgi:hypothetical protein
MGVMLSSPGDGRHRPFVEVGSLLLVRLRSGAIA